MKTSKTLVIALGTVALSFLISAYFYPRMDEMLASHWNAAGEADGYMPKFWALFIVPFISAGLLLLLAAIPRIDPLKANIGKFRGHYNLFILAMPVFMLYLHLLTIAWNLGLVFDFVRALAPAFGFLFYIIGVVMENTKRNWFIGIRTPWTMSSERVWDKTHRTGGRLFKAAGVIAVLGVSVPGYAIFLVLGPVVLFSAYLVIYSYLEYRKESE